MLSVFQPNQVNAQAPPVPSAYQALYTQEVNYLNTFNTTLSASGSGAQYAFLHAGTLVGANANVGPQLANSSQMTGIQLQLQEMQAMGVQAVMVEVGFPMLYAPFLTSQGQTQSAFVSFYQQVASMVHAMGMKLIVENDTLMSNDVQAGWNTSPFYDTLDWPSYQAARAADAVTIEQTMQPDYLVVLEEPDTEAGNTGQTNVNTSSGATSELSEILAGLQTYRHSGLKVGAGVGTWLGQFQSFIQSFVSQPMDFIDMHIYPINDSYLPNALTIASTAAGAGMPVAMSECWMNKELDSQVGSTSGDAVRALNTYSFWGPLDVSFLQTMEALANNTQMLFLAPSNTNYFYTYLTYDSDTESLPPATLLSQEQSAVSAANQAAAYSGTGTGYYSSIVTVPDKTPPTAPTGLTGVSGNPTTVYLTWNASTDNVGVAGYYVFRNGVNVATTGPADYQDTGVTEATTYTYAVQAFDLGGNVSPSSQSISVTSADVTPPTTPTNVAATAASCQKVTVTWSPSTDNESVNSYTVYWGMSPASLTQAGKTAGTTTSYTSYPLSASTTYYYAVMATDKSGNSSTLSATVPVTTFAPPAAPASVTATALATTKVSVAWSASASGGLPVQYYHVYRGLTSSGMTQVGVTSNTSYTDTSATASTKFYYAVQAGDTAGDLSPMSAIVSVTTPAAPSAPTGLTATAASDTRITLSWNAAASGGLPIQYYYIYRGASSSNMTQLAITQNLTYSDTTVTSGSKYYYGVEAADTGMDFSPMSTAVSITVPSAPNAPTNVAATAQNATKVSVTWTASVSGGLTVQCYHVYRGLTTSNMTQVGATSNTSYTDTTASASTKYYYSVQALDSAGDLSPMSTTVTVTTPGLPATPTGLTATASSTTKVTLSWNAAASGGLPIQYYYLYRGTTASLMTQLAITQNLTYTDTTVTSGAKYYYGVEAADTGMDFSPLSPAVSVTVPTAPGAPTNLVATPQTTTKTSLAWSASVSGGLAVQHYYVYRGTSTANLSQIATITTTSYTDTTGTPATTYYYAVQAADTGGDLSPMSTTVKATTLALPAAPTNVAVTAVSKAEASLTWTAAKSGMPLASYSIYRGTSASNLTLLKTVAATAVSSLDYPVSAGTTYYYGITAKDTGGNVSPMSTVVSVTTPN